MGRVFDSNYGRKRLSLQILQNKLEQNTFFSPVIWFTYLKMRLLVKEKNLTLKYCIFLSNCKECHMSKKKKEPDFNIFWLQYQVYFPLLVPFNQLFEFLHWSFLHLYGRVKTKHQINCSFSAENWSIFLVTSKTQGIEFKTDPVDNKSNHRKRKIC